jgi:hypothetical protein
LSLPLTQGKTWCMADSPQWARAWGRPWDTRWGSRSGTAERPNDIGQLGSYKLALGQDQANVPLLQRLLIWWLIVRTYISGALRGGGRGLVGGRRGGVGRGVVRRVHRGLIRGGRRGGLERDTRVCVRCNKRLDPSDNPWGCCHSYSPPWAPRSGRRWGSPSGPESGTARTSQSVRAPQTHALCSSGGWLEVR